MRFLIICACVASLGSAQNPPEKPSFEVASIKPSDPNPQNPIWIGMSADGAQLNFSNITLKDCIRAAFRVRDFQITGPDWITNLRFEIKAKLPSGATMDQISAMLQTLLEQRFKLEVRHDSKEQLVYVLTVGPGGAKLKPADMSGVNPSQMALGTDGKPRAGMVYGFNPQGVFLNAPAANMGAFAELMSRFTERPVVDKTGIEGLYDFKLTFAPETMQGAFLSGGIPAFSDPGPSLFDAVKDLGLKLEARKEPIEMIAVTHVNRAPTEN